MHLSGDVIEVKRPEEENNVEEKEHEHEVDQFMGLTTVSNVENFLGKTLLDLTLSIWRLIDSPPIKSLDLLRYFISLSQILLFLQYTRRKKD